MMQKKRRPLYLVILIIAIATVSFVVFLNRPITEAAFALQEIPPTAEPGYLTPDEQEMIENYRILLNQDDLDPALRTSIEEKLQMLLNLIELRASSQQTSISEPAQIDLPQVQSDSPVQIGFFEGDEGLFRPNEAVIQNYWQGLIEGEIVQVFAGATSADPLQGLVIVLTISSDRKSSAYEKYKTPQRIGSVRIASEDQLILVLAAENQVELRFDVRQKRFID